MSIYYFNASIENLKTWNIRRHYLSSKAKGIVKNVNHDHCFNVLDTSNSMSKFTMLFQFGFLKGRFYLCKFFPQLFIVYGFCLKHSINLPKLSIWEPFIDQLRYVIIPINTKTRRKIQYPKIQAFKDRYFLGFNLKLFLKDFSELVKYATLLVVLRTPPVETAR